MPLAALDIKGRKHISYELKPEEYRQKWMCPNCEELMYFVNSRLRIKHFRHAVDNQCEPEPETEEHISLKKYIYAWLSNAGYECNYEVKIGNRIADVTFYNPRKGILRIVECQVSLISNYEAQQRENDYYKNKVHEVYWVLYPKNYLTRYKKHRGDIVRLKDIERENMDSPRFFYFDPRNQQIIKLYFKPKWMKGGGECKTIFLIEKDELIIKNKQITNWGMVDNWIKGKQNFQIINI
ncbi:MAG: hypothetical protein JXA17_06310 [Dehalococcoidales bacterium]|nr:hypothetical protein [Dehalococcoidales bacterium]